MRATKKKKRIKISKLRLYLGIVSCSVGLILGGCSSALEIALVKQSHVDQIDSSNLFVEKYLYDEIEEKNNRSKNGFHEIIVSSKSDFQALIEDKKLDALYYFLKDCGEGRILTAGNVYNLNPKDIENEAQHFYAIYIQKQYWINVLKHNPQQPSEGKLREIYHSNGICLSLSAGAMLGSGLKTNQVQIKMDELE